MRKLVSVVILICLTVVASACGAGSGSNAKFPDGDLKFTIPNGPGGGNDLTVRALIPGMEKTLGVNVVPVNQPASGGAVAAMEVANAEPDGQTLYFNSQSLLLLPYGGATEVQLEKFQPVAQVVEDTAAIIVKADSPFNTLKDLIDHAKQNPAQLKIAHNGEGALWYLSARTFADAAGIKLNYIAYQQGGAQMLTALASGEVDIAAISPSESSQLINSGKLKVLAVMSDAKHPVVPEAPLASQAGLDVTFPVWRGVFTTAGVSKDRLQVLEKAVQDAVNSVEFQKYIDGIGLPQKFRGHEEFTKFVQEEKDKYAKIMEQ